MNLLALSGSLRAASINSGLLRTAARLAPAGITVTIYSGSGALPLFNPDLEPDPPAAVQALRAAVEQADALLFASPEYAHGISGSMKNTLDWLVSFAPFANKQVAVWNASPRAHHADDALREILRTMSAVIVAPASISLPLLGSHLDEQAMTDNPAIAGAIKAALDMLRESAASAAAPLVLPGAP